MARRRVSLLRKYEKPKFEEQNGICEACDRDLLKNVHKLNIHHKRAVKLGGGDEPENLALLHWRCNSVIGILPWTEETKQLCRDIPDEALLSPPGQCATADCGIAIPENRIYCGECAKERRLTRNKDQYANDSELKAYYSDYAKNRWRNDPVYQASKHKSVGKYQRKRRMRHALLTMLGLYAGPIGGVTNKVWYERIAA